MPTMRRWRGISRRFTSTAEARSTRARPSRVSFSSTPSSPAWWRRSTWSAGDGASAFRCPSGPGRGERAAPPCPQMRALYTAAEFIEIGDDARLRVRPWKSCLAARPTGAAPAQGLPLNLVVIGRFGGGRAGLRPARAIVTAPIEPLYAVGPRAGSFGPEAEPLGRRATAYIAVLADASALPRQVGLSRPGERWLGWPVCGAGAGGYALVEPGRG